MVVGLDLGILFMYPPERQQARNGAILIINSSDSLLQLLSSQSAVSCRKKGLENNERHCQRGFGFSTVFLRLPFTPRVKKRL